MTKNLIYFLFSLFFLYFSPAFSYAITPQQALEKLKEGNARYVHDALEHPNRGQERREAIVAKQFPFAIIVSCSDSRVSPEILFDQGVGDLFIVRVAGNVIGPLELDSIKYAVLDLSSSLIIIMGHENCGAVDAVIQNKIEGIEAVAKLIKPAVKQAKTMHQKNLLENAIKINALRMRNQVINSPAIQKLYKEKKIDAYAAYYHLQTGEVELLSK